MPAGIEAARADVGDGRAQPASAAAGVAQDAHALAAQGLIGVDQGFVEWIGVGDADPGTGQHVAHALAGDLGGR